MIISYDDYIIYHVATISIASDGWKTFFTNRTFMRLNSVKFCVEFLDLICYSVVIDGTVPQFNWINKWWYSSGLPMCSPCVIYRVPLFMTQRSSPSSVILSSSCTFHHFAVEFLLPFLLCTVPFFSSVHQYLPNQLLHQARGVEHMAVCKLTTVPHLSNPYME